MRVLLDHWSASDVDMFVSPALFSTAIAMLRPTRARRIVWVQDLYSLGMNETGTGGGFSRRAITALEKWVLNRADAVVAIHDRFKDYMVEQLGVPEECVHVIRNWSHISQPDRKSRDETRKNLGWSRDQIVVLHAGNQGVKQGLMNVVEAAQLAAEQSSKVIYVLLGGGSEHEELVEAGSHIANLQFIDSLPEDQYEAALAAADILLVNELPALSSMSVPSKLTSYFAAGQPVVAATDSGSVTAGEISASAGGIVVPAGSPVELLRACTTLGADLVGRQSMGQSGRKFAEERLTEASALDSFENLLQQLVG
jgi:glycosyltransferase involved in cell wall biosynthesis